MVLVAPRPAALMLAFFANLGIMMGNRLQGQQILPAQLISAEQCRGARGMLDLSREDLARLSDVAQTTISDFEAGRRQPYARTIGALRAALEAAGVQFIEENGGGPGVRLKGSR